MLRKSGENRFTLESTITLKEKREALVHTSSKSRKILLPSLLVIIFSYLQNNTTLCKFQLEMIIKEIQAATTLQKKSR